MNLGIKNMIDSDKCLDSNLCQLLKSASTDFIILNYGPIKRYSQIGVLSKFSDLCPIYWLGLGHTSVMSLDVYLRKRETVIDLRIGCRFENLKKDKCLWRRNRTWIWGLDVDLSLTYIITGRYQTKKESKRLKEF